MMGTAARVNQYCQKKLFFEKHEYLAKRILKSGGKYQGNKGNFKKLLKYVLKRAIT